MAWFKKVRKPIEPPAEKAEPGARRAVGQVPVLRAGHLQQGSRGEPQRLPEVRASLPASARPSGCACCSTATWTEHDAGLRSTDPLKFTDTKPYRKRLEADHRGDRHEGRRHLRDRPHRRHRDRRSRRWSTRFIGGSMGVVVGEKITRAIERAIERAAAGRHRLLLGRRADDGRRAVADADGQDQRRAGAARSRAAALHLGPHRSDDRRRDRELRDARRRQHRRAEGADRLRRPARHRADDPAEAARGLPAQRVPARARHARPGRRSPRDEGDARAACCAFMDGAAPAPRRAERRRRAGRRPPRQPRRSRDRRRSTSSSASSASA